MNASTWCRQKCSTKGPSVNIDIYLETKTSHLGGRRLSACSFLEKYRCTFCMCEHVQKKDQKYRYCVPFCMCSFLREGGVEEKRLQSTSLITTADITTIRE